jgi:hypothetical protein
MDSIPIPAIFHLMMENGMQHFVVVYKIKRQDYDTWIRLVGNSFPGPLQNLKNWAG